MANQNQPPQQYAYMVVRFGLAELSGILTTQGSLGYRLVSVINTVDTRDQNHQKYYSIWELPV